MPPTTTTPAWLLTGQSGPSSLEFKPEYELPPLGPNDVLVRIHAASLNYRELAIANVHEPLCHFLLPTVYCYCLVKRMLTSPGKIQHLPPLPYNPRLRRRRNNPLNRRRRIPPHCRRQSRRTPHSGKTRRRTHYIPGYKLRARPWRARDNEEVCCFP